MIIEFSVGNFRSFKEIQTLHLQAAKIKSKYPNVDSNNVFQANKKHQLLKSKVIYGANASGKSNLVKALVTMLRITKYSFKDDTIIQQLIEPFKLSKSSLREPTFFQICFILNGIPYRYGMQVQDGKVQDEWLFGTPDKREVYFFIREGMLVKVNENQFKEALKIIPTNAKETPIYGESSLFLTVASASKRKLAENISNYFSKKIGVFSGLDDRKMMNVVLNVLEEKTFNDKLLKLLKRVGMEVETIEKVEENSADILNQLPDNIKNYLVESENLKFASIEVTRKIADALSQKPKLARFNLSKHEAEGTKKMISLAPFLFTALEEGSVIVIDEFDARLHPRLSRKIVELFNSNDTNPLKAQLIIISHDTNLMDATLFRRDQISFVDKNKFGASRIYSLVAYKGIRNNSSFEKDYLKGKYDAVPFLNEVDNLFIQDKTS